jgi:hypothetical protein
MEIDWGLVKKKTLWQYEELIEKILEVLDYGFVQEHYGHTMGEAASYSEKIQRNCLQNGREASFIGEMIDHFKSLDKLGIRNYPDWVRQVDTRTKCELFLRKTGFDFGAFIQMLNYLFRWVLPFRCSVRELLDMDDETGMAYLGTLKERKLTSNLSVLENCRTGTGRTALVEETGMPETFILELVHRADLSRLAYVRGKTIKHLCGGGYDTLDKLANADMRKMETDMTSYYRTLGKSFSDFKAVIPLDWMVGGAKVLPRLVEE